MSGLDVQQLAALKEVNRLFLESVPKVCDQFMALPESVSIAPALDVFTPGWRTR